MGKKTLETNERFEELVCMTENSVLPAVTATATVQSAAVV